MKLSLPEITLMWVLICSVSHFNDIRMARLCVRNWLHVYFHPQQECNQYLKKCVSFLVERASLSIWLSSIAVTLYPYISSIIKKIFNLHIYVLHNFVMIQFFGLSNLVCWVLFTYFSFCVPAANGEDSSCWGITICIYLWSFRLLSSIWVPEYVHGLFCGWNEALVQGKTSFTLQLHSKPLLVCYKFYPFYYPLLCCMHWYCCYVICTWWSRDESVFEIVRRTISYKLTGLLIISLCLVSSSSWSIITCMYEPLLGSKDLRRRIVSKLIP